MCSFDDENEYQLINPHTQISLYSKCFENCSLETPIIHWNIYQGIKNVSTNILQWIQFNQSIPIYG